MWLIAWEDAHNKKCWEVISGEDATQIRVDEITKTGIHLDDIVVGEIPPAFMREGE